MKKVRKITIIRIIISFIIAILLLFPFESAGIESLKIFVNELIVIDIKYIIIAFFFVLAIITNFIEGRIARKNNENVDDNLIQDDVINRILVDTILIVLSSRGFIHPIIPIVVIARDSILSSIRMTALTKGKAFKTNNASKFKNILLMLGIFLTLIYNLPFELMNLKVSDIILVIATTLAAVSCAEYYAENKKIVIQK